MARIAVLGSINMDLVVETDRIPNQGETVLGNNFFTTPGGKGANQAVAAARLGAKVSMYGSIGNDPNGWSLKENLQNEGIDTERLNTVNDVATGVALIEICDHDNRIIVVPGANDHTNPEYLAMVAKVLLSYDVIIMQLEIPLESIRFITTYLSAYDKTIILNPAPAMTLPETLIDHVSYITPNEHEYKMVLNTTASIEEALQQYPNKLLITRGEEGVSYFDGEQVVTIPCIPVEVVDTTGAGDTFTGAFGVAISEGHSIGEAIEFANIAAGLSITVMGAQKGMPTRQAVLDKKKEMKGE